MHLDYRLNKGVNTCILFINSQLTVTRQQALRKLRIIYKNFKQRCVSVLPPITLHTAEKRENVSSRLSKHLLLNRNKEDTQSQ